MKEHIIYELLFVSATCVKSGILPGQLATLCALFRVKEECASRLSMITGLTTCIMHRTLNYLLQKGDVEYRIPQEHSGHVRQWRLTDKGRQRVLQYEEEYRERALVMPKNVIHVSTLPDTLILQR